ncbi:MAG: hypothetical protein MJZ48_01305 [Paludibacteraceae bacterium]|nr:hypothetical protein [Paludibacteraceae bacterium]
MKKIFSFVVALSLVASAYALSPKHQVTKLDLSKDARQEFKQQIAVNVPSDFKLASNAHFDQLAKKHQHAQVPAARRAINGDVYNVTIQEGYALYLGNYMSMIEEEDVGDMWELNFTGSNGEMLIIDFNGFSTDRIAGNYHNADAYICVTPGDTLDAVGTINIAYVRDGEEGSSPVYNFTGSFVDENGNTYNLSGEYAFPEGEVLEYLYYMFCMYFQMYCEDALITLIDQNIVPEGSEDVVVSTPAIKSYYGNEGAWYVKAQDNNYFASFQVYATDLTDGHYNGNDLDYTYTRVTAFDSGDTIAVDMYQPVGLDINTVNDTMFFNFSMIGLDAITYNVSMFYPMPVFTDTITAIVAGEWQDYIEDYGLVMLTAENDSIYYSTAVFANNIIGSFTEKDSYGGGYYDIVGLTRNNETTYYLPDHYTLTIEEGTGELAGYQIASILFCGYNQADRNDTYCFQLTAGLEKFDPYKYDMPMDTSYTFTAKLEDVMITDNFDKYGIVLVEAVDQQNGVGFEGAFILDNLDPTYVVPLDVYDINDTEEAPSMVASIGYDGEMDYPTYLLMYIGGYEYTWYIVEGSATMSADKLTVVGINSNGNKVNITINFTDTGLEEVVEQMAGKVSKFMHNGRVYMMHNSHLFDLLGNRMK